jgi:hypothetical protein
VRSLRPQRRPKTPTRQHHHPPRPRPATARKTATSRQPNKDGDGKPTDKDGDGKPTDKDGDGKPTDKDGDGKPTDKDGDGKPDPDTKGSKGSKDGAKDGAKKPTTPDDDGEGAEVDTDGDGVADAVLSAADDVDIPEGLDMAALAPYIRAAIGEVRGKVIEKVEDKMEVGQAKQMQRLTFALSGFSLAGLLLLFSPLFLRKKYPGKTGVLLKYGALAGLTFFLAVNLFAGIVLILRGAQQQTARYTNPQVAVVDAVFDNLDESADELGDLGHDLVEPTLEQLLAGSDEDPAVLLLGNAKKISNEMQVFKDLARSLDFVIDLLAYLPIVLTLVALVLFILGTKPMLLEIMKMPGRVAAGEEGIAKQVLASSMKRIGREMLATLALIGVLIAVTLVSSSLLSGAVHPAVGLLIEYLCQCIYYVQLAPGASSRIILLSLGGVILFLVLNLGILIASATLFLGKTQKIFQQRFQDGVPLGKHKKFFLWGILALVWAQVFPTLFVYAADPVVDRLLDPPQKGEEIPWTLLLVSGPLAVVVLFLFLAWALRVFKGLGHILKYKPQSVLEEPKRDAPPTDAPAAA